MTLARRITRLPRAYDPDLGAEARAAVPALTGDLARLVEGAGGSSPYLKELITHEAGWLPAALDAPEAALAGVMEAARALPPDRLKPGLRLAKRRMALLTALADLGGVWPLEQVTGALTDFAGLACDLALKAEIAALVRRGKLPGMTGGDVETAAGLSVLAMGKMGAGELNYSSDIDLICLFDETRYDPDDYHEARTGLVRATRAMCATLSDKTADGYVFRTDLRLRPDPAVTPVCMAMGAAETYYESLGRTWERAAYIKARPCAGDLAAGRRFLETLRPFVWRRHLDFAAIKDAHDIRLRIRESKGTGGPITIPGHDMKLGRGGIREIEFFTQTRQLIAGGRDKDLRVRGTVEGLAVLARKGWVSQDVADTLSGHYRALREVEHRIQMVHDAQTHRMPQSEDGIDRVACLMGVSVEAMQADLTERMTEVHALTEGFFAPGAAPQAEEPIPVGLDASVLERWQGYPSLRSARAAAIFEAKIKPELLARIARTAKPDEALLALDGFLAGLPAGVQLFSLFEANPQLLDLLVDIVGTSSGLATYLSRHSGVFDAVIGGDFFADWPGRDALTDGLAEALAAEADYERQLDTARRWLKEWRFRVGVHHLRGLVSGRVAAAQYTDLAEAVIAALLPVVTAQFARRHGPPPGRGIAVLGMGSLGAARLTATSDLDMIVVYDPQGEEASSGPKPLATRLYFARLTQALITALTVPTAEGRLYEVDMRLRPSGNKGPVATSLSAFVEYQKHDAWVWEHLALTRARPVAGDAGLCAEIEAFRRDLLAGPRDRAQVLREVAEMRGRIAAAKAPVGLWDAKIGPGRMQDIELLSQAGALLAGRADRDVAGGLEGAVATGLLDVADATRLRDSYDLYWAMLVAARLISGKVIDAAQIGEGGVAFLCRATGYGGIAALQDALADRYAQSERIISRALGGGGAEGETADEG